MAISIDRDSLIQLAIGPLFALVIFTLSFTKALERAELLSYDWRLNVRNNLFGPPPMDPRLGTIDIDDKSIEAEGRYQDWTRDKYKDVVSILSRFGASALAFDVYFTEPSARVISEDQVTAWSSLDSTSLSNLFRQEDHDRSFQRSIERAQNVYLAQFTVMGDEDVLARTMDKDAALSWLRENAPRLTVDPESSTLSRIIDFTPPYHTLRDAARGFAFAQSIADVDGARRRYPLVYQYQDVPFPSLALLVVCDYLGVPMANVVITPGVSVHIPDASIADGVRQDIDIPIDDTGTMIVNWTGLWDETFIHFPHIGLRWAAKQLLLDRIKELFGSGTRNPGQIKSQLTSEGHEDPEENGNALSSFGRSYGIERAIHGGATDAAEFWRSRGLQNPGEAQISMFEQIAVNNKVAQLLETDANTTSQSLRNAIADADSGQVAESEAYVRGLLVDGRVPVSARPLYYYPFSVFQGRVLTKADIEGKILFYGLTATGTEDLNVTPFQGDYPMVGIYPNVMNTILLKQFIRRIPPWIDALLTFAFGVLLSLVIPRLRVLMGAGFVLVVVVLYAIIAFLALSHAGWWLDAVGPLMTLVVGYLAITIYGYVIKEREKEFVQGAFGHYLSPAVVDEIMTNPDMINQLGGEERVMTSFFSDVASFSTISECLTPSELVHFINDYLSEMCDIIEHYGGTIDKFEGDAILAFFGAPAVLEDHAMRGTLSCIDQQRKLLELREQWATDRSLPPALYGLWDNWTAQGRIFAHVRMGMTAGPMVVGNMGSRTRTDYTMMGDTVNLAARFESGQKIYGTGIMVNGAIYEAVKDAVEARKLDLIQVMGKEEPVIAYEILERKGELNSTKSEVLELYNQGLATYERFDFVEAKKLFDRALQTDPTDGPSALYADRCEDFAINPPDDLIFRAESK
jgi:class 3 adenylate cyclase/CHASE2 domain-containing sensor protein